jgi:hypothetical protein
MLLIKNRKQQSNGVGEDHTSAVLISNAVAIRLEKGMINLSKNYRFGDRRGQLTIGTLTLLDSTGDSRNANWSYAARQSERGAVPSRLPHHTTALHE